VTQARDSLDILADVIRENYRLGTVSRPMPMPQAHQRRHQKLIVETTAGKFLAKTYKRDPYVLDALRFQHRLSDHLGAHDIPVARIQNAADGKRIVEQDNWAMELQELVDGEPMIVGKDTLIISAQALGRFHDVCRDFPRPERDAQMWRFSEVPRASFQSLYELSKQQGDPAQMDAYCNQIALFLHDAADALNMEQRSKFETGLIHGDWHSGNLIFHEGSLAAVVDLEFAGDGCYLEDLAYAISNLCVRTTMRPARLSKRTDVLLDNYQQFRTLSFHEEAALYFAVGVKHVATVAYQSRSAQGKLAGYTAAEWLERLAVQCVWLAERAKAVRFG
jgi:Ser/Thr protein kinase RdoA (MazF antagonist)